VDEDKAEAVLLPDPAEEDSTAVAEERGGGADEEELSRAEGAAVAPP
jgi:hypothetical protein